MKLTDMQNIGKVVGAQLEEVGIKTPADLKKVGSREAWLRIQAIDPSACYNRLMGLEGAIKGIRWHFLSDQIKKDLKTFYESHKLKK